MPVKHTEQSMQHALTGARNLFAWSRYAVVPNVSYGLLIRGEADLICASKAGIFHEVEIKVSRSDLKADQKKRYAHEDPRVAYTWFAVPQELESDALELLPERYGLVVVHEDCQHPDTAPLRTKIVRMPQKNPKYTRKPTDADMIKLLRLGVMRMWTNAVPIYVLQQQNHELYLENNRLRAELGATECPKDTT
jgi:hypothetical protein